MVKYQHLAESLKRQIQRGFYKENEYIPSEQELAELYNVSKITVRGAINLLVEKQMLSKERGKKTKVISSEPAKKIIPRQNLNLGLAFNTINLYSDKSDMPEIIHGITSSLNPWKENLSLFPFEINRDQVELIRHLLENNVVDGIFLLSMGEQMRSLMSFLDGSSFPYLLVAPDEDEFMENLAKEFNCPALLMAELETIRVLLEKHFKAGATKVEIFGIEGAEVKRTVALFERAKPVEDIPIQNHIFKRDQDYFAEIVKSLTEGGNTPRLLVIGTPELGYYMDSALRHCNLYGRSDLPVLLFKHYSSRNEMLKEKFTVIDRDLHKLGMKAAEILCGLVRKTLPAPGIIKFKSTISEYR